DRLLLRRHDQRLRRDAGLREPDPGRGPLGDRVLSPRAAARAARTARATDRPGPGCRRGGRDPSREAAVRARRGGGPLSETVLHGSSAGGAGDFTPPSEALSGLERRAFAIGAGALILGAIGGVLNPAQFFRSYLVAFVFCLGVP